MIFTNQNIHQERLLSKLDNSLGNSARDTCEGPVTRKKIDTALKRMHDNKAPGLDRLSTEFYRTFWPLLTDELLRIFNIAYENEQLSESQMSSLVRLLFKKGEKDHIENLRPIYLMNIDYKVSDYADDATATVRGSVRRKSI